MTPSTTQIVRNFDELVRVVGPHRYIEVDGSRGVGKNYLIERLEEALPDYRRYEKLYPRKHFMTPGGSAKAPAGMDLQQATLWVLDFVRQHPDLKVIANRGFLSSMHWDQPRKDRFEVWQEMMVSVDGVVVFVEPTFTEHRKRLSLDNRSHLLNSVIVERKALNAFAHELEGEGILWFQEG